MSNQLWFSRCPAASDTVSNYWTPLGGPSLDGTLPTTHAAGSGTVSADGGTLKSMHVRLSAAPGGGKSRTVRVVVDGTPSAVLTATISGTDTTVTVTGDVIISAGQTVGLEQSPSGTPAASDVIVTVEYQPNTANYFLYSQCCANGGNLGTAGTIYLTALQTCASTVGNGTLQTIVPFAGTIREIYIQLTAAPGVGKNRAFTLVKNAVDVATYTIADANTVSNNSGLTTAVASGDKLYWKQIPTGTPTNAGARIAIVIEPSVSGRFALPFSGAITGTDFAADNFLQLAGGNSNVAAPWSTTEATHQMSTHRTYNLTSLYVGTATSVNTGAETLTVTVRKNGIDGALTAQLNSTNTTLAGDTAHTDVIGANDLVCIKISSAEGTGDLSAWHISLGAEGLAAVVSGGQGTGGKGKGGSGKPPGGKQPSAELRTFGTRSWSIGGRRWA